MLTCDSPVSSSGTLCSVVVGGMEFGNATAGIGSGSAAEGIG